MASTPTPAGDGSLDFSKAFRFFFEDPEWVKKALIGGLLYLGGFLTIVLLGAGLILFAIAAGFMMRVIQRSWAGDPKALPDWDDYGGMLRDGFKAIGLAFVYTLLSAIVPGVLMLVLFVAGAGASRAGSEAAGGLLALAMVFVYAVGLLLHLVVSIYLPSALTRMTLYQRFGAGFEFRENIDFIKRNPKNYFMAFLASMLANAAAGVCIFACCVGIFPAMFWSACVMGFSFGQVARNDSFLGQQVAAPALGV